MQIHAALALAGCAGLLATQALSQARPESLLERSWRDCRAFEVAVARTEFEREPNLFTCHHFAYKPLMMWGYIRFLSRTRYQIVLRTDKHGVCQGTGTMGFGHERGRRHISAADRFECRDGSQGGTAWELDYVTERGKVIKVGTILGGIDGHRDGIDNDRDRISADFYVYDRAALRDMLRLD